MPEWFDGDPDDLGSQAATSSRHYEGDAFTGMRGEAPASTNRTFVGVHDTVMPKARERFGSPAHLDRLRDSGRSLEPNTAYEVRGRGTFYTDGKGRVAFVEPTRRTVSLPDGSLFRSMMSTDLRNPLPNTTYFVDDYAYFATDDLGRATHIHIEDVELRDGTQRSRAAQRNVGGGVEGYDAGHGLARLFGGAREEINRTRMISELNQGQTGNPRTVKAIENTLHAALKDTTGRSGISFDLKIEYPKGRASSSGSTWSVPPRSYDFTIVQGGLPIKHRMADGNISPSSTSASATKP